MSSNPYSDNPYTAPHMAAGAPLRPGGLTVVAVLAIVLGVLGLMSGCFGGIALAVGPYMQNAFQPPAGASGVEKFQIELNQELMAINQRFFVPHMISMVALVVIATFLIIGGIKVLKISPGGRKLLLYTFLALIVLELGRTGLQAFAGLQTLPVYEETMNRMVREVAGQKEEPFLKSMAKATYGMTVFFMVVGLMWGLAKILVYGLCSRYLSKPNIVDLFEGQAASEGAK